MTHPVLGPHPFAGARYYGESPALREQRFAAVAPVLGRSGFKLERPPLDALAALAPWPFPPPSYALALARGACDGAEVELHEYGSIHGASAAPALQSHAVVLARHGRLDGRVQLFPDPDPDKQPPGLFARVRAAVLGAQAGPEDLVVGDQELDRLYVVHAPSVEAARRALPPALRRWIAGVRFAGAVDVRPGMLLYSVPGAILEPAGVGRLLAPLGELLEAATSAPPQGYRG